jgi:hypothetical protein
LYGGFLQNQLSGGPAQRRSGLPGLRAVRLSSTHPVSLGAGGRGRLLPINRLRVLGHRSVPVRVVRPNLDVESPLSYCNDRSLVPYDQLMLCKEGGAVDFFDSGAAWRDGITAVSVSGGLESK